MKDRYYWAQLRAALTAGRWAAPAPARAPNGHALSWADLLRKFAKHCHGFADVAETASQTHALALWLGDPEGGLVPAAECVLPPERVPEAAAGYAALQALPPAHADSLHFALAYYAYALGDPAQCLAHLAHVPAIGDAQSHIPASVRSDASVQSSSFSSFTPNVADGRAWAITESLRSLCLQGMSREKLDPATPGPAIDAYAAALPLLGLLESEIPRSPTSFTQYRELWCWVERLLFRAIAVLARTRPLDDPLIWSLFAHYTSCSPHWPPTFRTAHRSLVAVLHLRAIVIALPSAELTARSVIAEYRTVLDKSTRFPSAGERNTKVEDLVDLSVAVWEANGAMPDRAHWVIDVLWWATRLTFNSYRVFRHMTRMLYVSGDTELAKRTLRLYVEVVSKTRAAGVDGDSDTDHSWVETLVQGARMLCRLALSRVGSGGVEEAKEAGDLLEKAKTRLHTVDTRLVASVALAEGIWNTVTAIIGKDDRTRTTRLQRAIELYTRSVQVFPTPSAHHQLAIALALPGPSHNIEDAITSARAAVEMATNEIRHWHLLGLLLTAQGEWSKAREVLDMGASIDESPDDRSDSEVSPVGLVHEMLLDQGATTIPPSSTLLQALPDHPNSTPQDTFEYALQLRLTQMALTEHVEGPEGAETRWVDVFGWIAERKGAVPDTPRMSTHSILGGSSVGTPVTRTNSTTLVSEVQLITETVLVATPEGTPDSSIYVEPSPITVMVTPATPAEPDRKFPFSHMHKRGLSTDRDTSKGKKMQQMLKNRVHKGQEKISTISRKIGHGVVRRHGSFKRTNSAPDFHAVLQNHHYQASSIHSRRPLRSLKRRNSSDGANDSISDCPVPPPPPTPPPQDTKPIPHASREDKLLSELWASCAATFRRLGKIDQAKGAIQEAEVKNQENPSVWVQLGLYHHALKHDRQAIESFQKALFMCPDDISACVHMCQIHLTPTTRTTSSDACADPDKIDLSAGLLGYMARGPGWDVPEVWYFLAKAYALRGQEDRQRECLVKALELCEHRCIRDLGRAVGWCL